jgi:hypothetical protein
MIGTHRTAAAGAVKPAKHKIERQLRKIVHSEALRQATALQRMLQYLGSKALEDPLAEIKEYTIGVEVFERGHDYDPKIDTIVRVQIHRLRLKLKEFYETEGIDDQILVEFPKGHYLPTFEARSTAVAEGASPELVNAGPFSTTRDPESPNPVGTLTRAGGQRDERRPNQSWPRKATLVSAAVLLYACGLLMGAHWGKGEASGGSEGFPLLTGSLANASDDPVRTFWASFMQTDRAPVVGFADAVFLADQSSDRFRLRRGASDDRGTPVDPHLAKEFASNPELVEKAGPLYYDDGFSGTGDVEGIFALTRMFTELGYPMTVKRCRLITVDDMTQHSVILLGSPDQNDAVARIPQNLDFVFEPGNPPGAWRGRIANRHPQPGESPAYQVERDPATQELKASYGLVTIQPGVTPGRYIAILASLDTSGVAGDAQFVSSPADMAELTDRLKSMGEKIGNGPPPTFQALLRVDVEKGNDVLDVKLVAVHVVHLTGEAESNPNSSSSQPPAK